MKLVVCFQRMLHHCYVMHHQVLRSLDKGAHHCGPVISLLRIAHALRLPAHCRARLLVSLSQRGMDRLNRQWQLRLVEVLLLAATM